MEILKNVIEPIGRLLRVDDGSINSFNVVAIRVLIEIDVFLLLKQMLREIANFPKL